MYRCETWSTTENNRDVEYSGEENVKDSWTSNWSRGIECLNELQTQGIT